MYVGFYIFDQHRCQKQNHYPTKRNDDDRPLSYFRRFDDNGIIIIVKNIFVCIKNVIWARNLLLYSSKHPTRHAKRILLRLKEE